jgi:hypothetical protein
MNNTGVVEVALAKRVNYCSRLVQVVQGGAMKVHSRASWDAVGSAHE